MDLFEDFSIFHILDQHQIPNNDADERFENMSKCNWNNEKFNSCWYLFQSLYKIKSINISIDWFLLIFIGTFHFCVVCNKSCCRKTKWSYIPLKISQTVIFICDIISLRDIYKFFSWNFTKIGQKFLSKKIQRKI